MTSKLNYSSDEYEVTASLLNSWLNIFTCDEHVREAEKDEISLEDKQSDARKKALDEFTNYLNRVPAEPNEYMKRGIEFEQDCYDGKTEISPIIEGGSYQLRATKRFLVDGHKVVLVGVLDVLKGGTIYDIKRVVRYAPQKYLNSYQHEAYFELFPNAKEFTYLVHDDNGNLHKETYYRDNCDDIKIGIKNFYDWLKANNLFKTYKEKWRIKK